MPENVKEVLNKVPAGSSGGFIVSEHALPITLPHIANYLYDDIEITEKIIKITHIYHPYKLCPVSGQKKSASIVRLKTPRIDNEEKTDTSNGTVSLPFTPGKAVTLKIIDAREIERLKIIIVNDKIKYTSPSPDLSHQGRGDSCISHYWEAYFVSPPLMGGAGGGCIMYIFFNSFTIGSFHLPLSKGVSWDF